MNTNLNNGEKTAPEINTSNTTSTKGPSIEPRKLAGIGLIAVMILGIVYLLGSESDEDITAKEAPSQAIQDTSVITDKSLIDERREKGIDIDQRLEKAKAEQGMRDAAGGAAEWMRVALDDVARSTASLKILGAPVTQAEVTLYEVPVLAEETQQEAEKSPGIVDGLKSKAKGALTNIITDAVKSGLSGN
ncbi:hypothetical protein [Roseovarius mucosus]|nr:hypothetical protein [Roseovarius mucosus]